MSSTRWQGTVVRKARAHWKTRIQAAGYLPCWRCGKALTVDSDWTVGHIMDRGMGGSVTDVSNQWPECAKCNYSAGGKVGAAITNGRKPVVAERMASEKDRGIRGI